MRFFSFREVLSGTSFRVSAKRPFFPGTAVRRFYRFFHSHGNGKMI
ncbi:hypothetical protein HMPREF0080_00852 [Anaeroglobus geminatus F0357]|uniref:Uncharacterized protein n=1 Tax=Anaeroglobus geminatus F0357 TaxID=861450 RepID=G9YGT2_9FIRM|nr:hypothetical protein HMPREF0080_00852 [Anaeroglobus geminatus F0357]